ncbi:hypothetical protein EI555_014105 [Monodon monoceros]|nr:hypothetical protein EI555_014105 [Monodon monoceros]
MGGAPGRARAGGGEPGGQRAAEEAGPRPYDRTGRGPTAARAACGHCRASLIRRSHMRLWGCRERAPEASRRYLRPGARTRVTANLTSSHSVCTFIWQDQSCRRMDSEVQRDGRILDLIDDAWREDKLPYEDVAIPLNELPEPEQDNGGTTESVKEQEMKWTDLALQYLHENVPPIGN